MAENNQKFIDRCIKDKNGKVVLGQSPNIPIVIFISLTLCSFILPEGQAKATVSQLATCFAVVWAYLEITQGVNYFRRVLGIIIMIFVVVNMFAI